MENKYFLNQQLLNGQSVISIMGPSGTGKSVCASFLENFGYKIVPQITTRNPRPDDKYYTYISHKEFVPKKPKPEKKAPKVEEKPAGEAKVEETKE